ncbi:MCE family protein [Nocardioides bigeumensis]|uniref:MCE family protein n=1 Tax=Nocardioides bigeumensis TaxID=433657 RepID=A0ABP5KJ55_9ACTN
MDLRKIFVPALLVGLLVAALVTFKPFFGDGERKTVVAHFPRAISIFEGSDVRVLGVAVGTVDQVVPSGTDVEVTMSYDADVRIPEDASAVIIAPSIVGDRFVQLTPAYDPSTKGAVLADGAELGVDRTSVPLELDQVYSSLNDLNVALGPTGANKQGALSDLLEVTADNFDGQGAAFHQTIADFGRFSQTLSNNREELFGTAAKLQSFLETLADNDTTVRQFNRSLADISGVLSGERQELAAALDNLGTALSQVSGFVKENRDILGRNIKGLNRVSKVLVKQRDSLDEILRVGPLALNNLALTYNPQAGTLDTRANLGELVGQIENDPALLLCSIVEQADDPGNACDLIKKLLPGKLPLPGAPRGVPFTPGFGGGERSGDRYDPTLGGLVASPAGEGTR